MSKDLNICLITEITFAYNEKQPVLLRVESGPFDYFTSVTYGLSGCLIRYLLVFVFRANVSTGNGAFRALDHQQHLGPKQSDFLGQGHFVTSHSGDNMASVTWATKVSTKWVDQIDQLTDIFEEVSIFVVWLGRFAPFAK